MSSVLEERIKNYKLIKANTKSLLSSVPTEKDSHPYVVILDAVSEHFEGDRDWVQKNFPKYRIFDLHPQVQHGKALSTTDSLKG